MGVVEAEEEEEADEEEEEVVPVARRKESLKAQGRKSHSIKIKEMNV